MWARACWFRIGISGSVGHGLCLGQPTVSIAVGPAGASGNAGGLCNLGIRSIIGHHGGSVKSPPHPLWSARAVPAGRMFVAVVLAVAAVSNQPTSGSSAQACESYRLPLDDLVGSLPQRRCTDAWAAIHSRLATPAAAGSAGDAAAATAVVTPSALSGEAGAAGEEERREHGLPVFASCRSDIMQDPSSARQRPGCCACHSEMCRADRMAPADTVLDTLFVANHARSAVCGGIEEYKACTTTRLASCRALDFDTDTAGVVIHHHHHHHPA
jgi:hypothetical protein